MAGVTSITVSRWERGVESPRLEHLVGLARGLGYPLSWFVQEETGDGPGVLPPTVGVILYGTVGEGLSLDPAGGVSGDELFQIGRSRENRDGHSYAVLIKTSAFLPYFLPEDVLELVTDLEARSGDVVLLYHRDGRKLIRIVRQGWQKERLALESVNRVEEPEIVPRAAVLAVHRIISIRRKGMY